jgi:L-ascorbate metabolism protein UlaG (beta-lactamase superfamily)
MKTILRRTLLATGIVVLTVVVGAFGYLQHPKFGAMPQGARLERVAQSPHYLDGLFRNLDDAPVRTDGDGFFARTVKRFQQPTLRLRPEHAMPSIKTDLHTLNRAQDVIVWLGHSSFYVQAGGKRILIDPVFSESATPVPWTNDAFDGTTPYGADDFPPLDVLLISHDHWDHLDHPTMLALKDKVSTVVTGLGVGAHLERWGFQSEKIREADWFGAVTVGDALTVHVLPARHYSGRAFARGKTLWSSFALITADRRLYFGGDSGFGSHFAEIGRRFGSFDAVALDTGQYDARWAHIHMTPEEAARAAQALGAKALIPAHVGRFQLARHPWDEPFQRSQTASKGMSFQLLTPMIGEPVLLDRPRSFVPWWERHQQVSTAIQ